MSKEHFEPDHAVIEDTRLLILTWLKRAGLVAILISCVVGLVFWLKNRALDDAYDVAATMVKNHKLVRDHIGTPIHASWRFRVDRGGDASGDALFGFQVLGPRGMGTAYPRMHYANGKWEAIRIRVKFEDFREVELVPDN